MAIKFHKAGFDNAVRLIQAKQATSFDANWEEEKPTKDEIVHFINAHYMSEYGLWFLGTDSNFPEDAREHYVYPYGDLKLVQRCALVDTLKKSEQNKDSEITNAAKRLLEMLDKK